MESESLTRYKTKPYAWQIGWFCARDGKPHDLVYAKEEILQQYNEGYEAYQNYSQVHCHSNEVQ